MDLPSRPAVSTSAFTKIYTDMVSALDDDTALIIVCQVLSQRVSVVPQVLADIDANHQGAATLMLASIQAGKVQEVAQAAQAANVGRVEGRYYGYVKSFQLEQGYGFISCPELKAVYGKDAFLHHHQLGPFQVGSEVSFVVRHNKAGDPQAQELEDATGVGNAAHAAQQAAQAAHAAVQTQAQALGAQAQAHAQAQAQALGAQAQAQAVQVAQMQAQAHAAQAVAQSQFLAAAQQQAEQAQAVGQAAVEWAALQAAEVHRHPASMQQAQAALEHARGLEHAAAHAALEHARGMEHAAAHAALDHARGMEHAAALEQAQRGAHAAALEQAQRQAQELEQAALEKTLQQGMPPKRRRTEGMFDRGPNMEYMPPANGEPAMMQPVFDDMPAMQLPQAVQAARRSGRVPDLMSLLTSPPQGARGRPPPDTPGGADVYDVYDPTTAFSAERADELRSATQQAQDAQDQLMMEMAFQAATPQEQVASYLREQAMAFDGADADGAAAAQAPKDGGSAALDAAAIQALQAEQLQEHALQAFAAEQLAAQSQHLGFSDQLPQGYSDETMLAQALLATQAQQQRHGASPNISAETLRRAQAFAHMTFDRQGLAIPAGRKGVPCKFFGEGRCQKGDTCDFSHDPEMFMEKSLGQKSPTPCTFFNEGRCSRGAACPFAHGMEELMAIQAAKVAAKGQGRRGFM